MREIDPSLPKLALSSQPTAKGTLNLMRAMEQHRTLAKAIKSCGVEVHTLASHDHADSVFVEDCAVVIGDTVLITRPGAASRQPETIAVQMHYSSYCRANKMNMIVMEEGMLDGGDVLYTGQDLFVGLTQRTDMTGVRHLQQAFPHIPVTPVKLSALLRDDAAAVPLHLKSFCSMGGEGVVLVGGNIGTAFADTLPAKYHIVELPSMEAANCVFVNGTLIHRGDLPNSERLFQSVTTPRIAVDADELAKVDGALTCCSVLS